MFFIREFSKYYSLDSQPKEHLRTKPPKFSSRRDPPRHVYSVGSNPLGVATLRRSKCDPLLVLRTLGYKNSYSTRLSLCDNVIKTYANCSLSACLVSRNSVLGYCMRNAHDVVDSGCSSA